MAGTQNLFMDKIKLSALVVDKVGQLIGAFADLVVKISSGFITDNILQDSKEWKYNWRLMLELNSFVYYSKIEKNKMITQEEKDKVNNSLYIFIHHKEGNNYNTLVDVYHLILKFISLSGYMDDKVTDMGGSWDDEEFI